MPLVDDRAGKRHRLAVELHGIGDPIRPRHKAGALCDRRFHGQGAALHVVGTAACRKFLYKGVDQLVARHRRPIVRRTRLISLDADDAEVAFCKQIYVRLAELGCLPVGYSRRDLIQPPRSCHLCADAKPLSASITNNPGTKFFIIKIFSSRRAESG
jgi:hypothetical protein